jgi:predicted nucleic acid-binding protein
MLLADADFFIGLYFKEDIHHTKCLRYTDKIQERKETVITSYDVISEVTTKLRYNIFPEVSRIFLEDMSSGEIVTVFPTPQLFEKARALFNTIPQRHTSWTDFINMVIAKEKGITTILSFDKGYKNNGFALYGETI